MTAGFRRDWRRFMVSMLIAVCFAALPRSVAVAAAPEADASPTAGDVPRPVSVSRSSWRLMQGLADAKGHSAVSITKIADTEHSDMALIGVMIKCNTPSQIEVAMIVADPFAPRSSPTVGVDSPRGAVAYQGQVAPGGTAIVLPNAAVQAAASEWQSVDRIAVRVGEKDHQIAGEIELRGLPSAYSEMMAKCAR